ncbi:SIMPL domain-containing protein [Maritalea mediterranea]|uniref:SIMPL domain-containing protein n=1 Tax=Maritalea mediterranea TaxID=2909667 RepID=A0ABS9EA09_9HYPH|nr:SIMPL domain-containing protein [Maritalea mediterranea]MCF4099037.1 SIMPL domain-containing protein [Maritalea mediterranea]
MRTAIIISAILLALGVSGAGWLAGQSLERSREPIRTVTVKGLAEQQVKADLGFWPIKFVATGPTLDTARAELEQAEKAVRAFLANNGFGPDTIEVQNIKVEDRFTGYNGGNYPAEARFTLTEDLLVTTNEVDQLAEAARNITDLLRAGVVFSSDAWSGGPSFVFTDLNDLKGDMLTEATQRAREAAQQFAIQSDSKVGNIQTANQGVFQILPAVDIPNDRPDRQIEKKVRVVTTITYFLID